MFLNPLGLCQRHVYVNTVKYLINFRDFLFNGKIYFVEKYVRKILVFTVNCVTVFEYKVSSFKGDFSRCGDS